jgi:hypothetical protein
MGSPLGICHDAGNVKRHGVMGITQVSFQTGHRELCIAKTDKFQQLLESLEF